MDVNDSASEDSENVRENLIKKAYVVGFREYPSHHEQTVGRNKNIEGNTGEESHGNEGHVRNQREDSSYIAARNLAELGPAIIWKLYCKL